MPDLTYEQLTEFETIVFGTKHIGPGPLGVILALRNRGWTVAPPPEKLFRYRAKEQVSRVGAWIVEDTTIGEWVSMFRGEDAKRRADNDAYRRNAAAGEFKTESQHQQEGRMW